MYPTFERVSATATDFHPSARWGSFSIGMLDTLTVKAELSPTYHNATTNLDKYSGGVVKWLVYSLGHVKKLVQVHTSVGELPEGTLLLDLNFRLGSNANYFNAVDIVVQRQQLYVEQGICCEILQNIPSDCVSRDFVPNSCL